MRFSSWTFLILATALALAAAAYFWVGEANEPTSSPAKSYSFEQLTNTVFTAEPVDAFEPPEVRLVRMPPVPGDAAVWGATGRDDSGHIWIGVSMSPGSSVSARLVEYDPLADEAFDRGDVLNNLERLGLLQPDEEQVKIHSRIVQAGDGHLYFASMNDTHEEGGPRAPPFGSHLWRLRLPERRWEHLLAAPEGLIAVAGGGDYIYALGYPNHRLLQYYVPSGKARWVSVGSFGGHISRNFIVDARGHVFVPRLQSGPAESAATLVEFDTDLRELQATPLQYYLHGSPDAGHGIIAFQHLPDRSIYFATDLGRLYRIDTDFGKGPGLVTDAGWFDSKGTMYTPSLFTYSGAETLVGLGYGKNGGSEKAVWLTRDFRLRITFPTRFNLPKPNGKPLSNVLLYGSETRDRAGNFYVVGAYRDGNERPLVLQIRQRLKKSDAEKSPRQ